MVQKNCFYYMLLYVFSLDAGAMMIVMVGLDRLLALVAATRLEERKIRLFLTVCRYKNWSRTRYVTLMTLPALLYSLACIVLAFVNISDEEIVYFCIPPSAFRLYALDLWILTNMLICLSVIVIYAAAFVAAKKLGASAYAVD